MLTTIFSIVGILASILGQYKGVLGTAGTLTTSLLTPVENLIASLRSGQQSVTSEVLAALAAASGVIAVLKATTGLPADVLTQINGVDKDVQAALTAYAQAGAGFDASLYTQIAPVA